MLDLSFYARDARSVAKALLGQILISNINGKSQRTRIVETEAYLGVNDLASHASKGRTKRSEIIFGPPGVAYVYLIYGMYDMFNIVTAELNTAHAVLIRAVEPLSEGLANTNGPGKLCKALGITRAHNGLTLFGPELWLEAAPAPEKIITTTRIGIDYAKEWKDAPLRFYDAASTFVSKHQS